MTSHEKISRFKIRCVLAEHEKYDFPTFLLKLRNTLGINRHVLARDTCIPMMRLFYLEHGHFARFPEKHIEILSDYYEIPIEVLKKKSQEFLASGKSHCYQLEQRKKQKK